MRRTGRGLALFPQQLGAPVHVDRGVIGDGNQQEVVAVECDPHVVPVRRLDRVAERVDPGGDGLVLVVRPGLAETHDTQERALTEEAKAHAQLGRGGLGHRHFGSEPEVGQALPVCDDLEGLRTEGLSDLCAHRFRWRGVGLLELGLGRPEPGGPAKRGHAPGESGSTKPEILSELKT